MFCPGFATAEMQRSNEQEQPEHKTTSSGPIPSPICSATAFLASKYLKLTKRICFRWDKLLQK